MIVMNSSIIEESDFRHDGIHPNEIGVTKLIEHVDNFLKNSGMKTVIKNSNGFLADRPYRKISREYIFGCKQCFELHEETIPCSPGPCPTQPQTQQQNHGAMKRPSDTQSTCKRFILK